MRPGWLALLVLVGCLAFAGTAKADQFRPAYLQITQLEEATDRYAILWKVPALDEGQRLAIDPVFPPGTTALSPQVSSYAAGATVLRWEIRTIGGLEGSTLSFTGRSQPPSGVLVRYRAADGTEQVGRVSSLAGSMRIQVRPGPIEVARSYTVIGIEHILAGIDHLLFVLALVLIVKGWKRLLATITAFTLAHSITLALATLDIIRLPGPPVEALIALSIVFVASEILRMKKGRPNLAARKPWLVAFFFGLLHGLGFASALSEVGLPPDAVPLALLFFNVGVEVGQLLFVAAILAIVAIMRRLPVLADRAAPIRSATAILIGCCASFWVFERVAAF